MVFIYQADTPQIFYLMYGLSLNKKTLGLTEVLY